MTEACVAISYTPGDDEAFDALADAYMKRVKAHVMKRAAVGKCFSGPDVTRIAAAKAVCHPAMSSSIDEEEKPRAVFWMLAQVAEELIAAAAKDGCEEQLAADLGRLILLAVRRKAPARKRQRSLFDAANAQTGATH